MSCVRIVHLLRLLLLLLQYLGDVAVEGAGDSSSSSSSFFFFFLSIAASETRAKGHSGETCGMERLARRRGAPGAQQARSGSTDDEG